MKAIRSRMLAFLLVGVVLTLSTGMGLVEHTCQMSGKKGVSMQHRTGCCSKKASHSSSEKSLIVKADKCCEVETHFLKINFVSVQEKFSKLFANLYFVVTEKVVDVFNALLHRSKTTLSYTNSSPPVSGRMILIRHCTLQV